MTSQPMNQAPKDGTRILAWWPPFDEVATNGGWCTTWFGIDANGQPGWENSWEWERPESRYSPTHWMQHPEPPK